MKKILYIDMDGVLVDFKNEIDLYFNEQPLLKKEFYHNPDEIKGIFLNPKPIEGSIFSVNKLKESGKYDLYIATSATWGNVESAMHKRIWIEKHFGDLFKKKMMITHRKDLLIGDYLIDDREANGAKNFSGELLPFGWAYEKKKWNKYPTWDSILDYLL
jgi:5'(3')-deoxyribonucleotidase